MMEAEAAQDGNAERSAAWATQAGGGTSGAPWRADPRFAGDGYVLLDSLRVRPEDLRHDNAAALLAGLENPSDETYAGLLAALQQRLRAPEFRGLKKILLAWAAWQARRRLGLELEVEDMMEADRLEDYGDVEAYFAARIQARKEEHRAEGREAGREAGREEGRVVGQRESLRRHAAMKFDSETAARLGAVLEGVTDQEAFDGVLAALLECDTPSDLLERATEVRRRTNGRATPRPIAERPRRAASPLNLGAQVELLADSPTQVSLPGARQRRPFQCSPCVVVFDHGVSVSAP